jgi:hypothetical protein
MSSKTMGPLLQVGTCPHVRRDWGSPPPTSASELGSPRPHLHRDWDHPCRICTGTGLAPATSAPGLGSPLPHLHRDWAHPAHIGAGTAGTGHRRARRRCASEPLHGVRPAAALLRPPELRLSVPVLRLSVPLLPLSVPLLRSSVPVPPLSVPGVLSGTLRGTPRGTITLHGVLCRCSSGSASPTPSACSPSGSRTTRPSSTRPRTARSRSRCYRTPARACYPARYSAGTTACSSRMRQRHGCMRTCVLRPRRAAWWQR